MIRYMSMILSKLVCVVYLPRQLRHIAHTLRPPAPLVKHMVRWARAARRDGRDGHRLGAEAVRAHALRLVGRRAQVPLQRLRAAERQVAVLLARAGQPRAALHVLAVGAQVALVAAHVEQQLLARAAPTDDKRRE